MPATFTAVDARVRSLIRRSVNSLEGLVRVVSEIV
jgi:hypothetical protein